MIVADELHIPLVGERAKTIDLPALQLRRNGVN